MKRRIMPNLPEPVVARLYPENLVLVIRLNGIELRSAPMYGGDIAIKVFSKSPYMKEQIRNIKPEEVLELGSKMLSVGVFVASPGAKEDGRNARVAASGPRLRGDWNALKDRPFASEEERIEVRDAVLSGQLKVELPPDDGEATDEETAKQEIMDTEAGYNKDAKATGTLCPKCRKKLYQTTPGVVCINGHWKKKGAHK